jgi:hypothetical protein
MLDGSAIAIVDLGGGEARPSVVFAPASQQRG